MKPGGTEGGSAPYLAGIGLLLLGVGLYFFFDSVQIHTDGGGFVSGAMRRGRGGAWETTSMGLIFVPLFIASAALFYNAKLQWAWVLLWLGLAIVVVEILSRIRFHMVMKTSHALILLTMVAAGVGLMIRGIRAGGGPPEKD